MRFEYDEKGFVRDNESDDVILKGKNIESRKFLKMATILINKEFEKDDLNTKSGMRPIVYKFETYYEDILDED